MPCRQVLRGQFLPAIFADLSAWGPVCGKDFWETEKRGEEGGMRQVDLRTEIGEVVLPNPVLAASGCFGAGAELLGVVDPSRLGAVVSKSMSFAPWEGNPAPRLAPAPGGGMLNAVGLQNPGVEHWAKEELPRLLSAGARVVASIWGTSVDEYIATAKRVGVLAEDLVAVEVNVSCPNLESPGEMFAHSPIHTAAVVRAVKKEVAPLPVWAKLSPNLPSVVEVARAAADAGADALVLVNTLIGLLLDVERRVPLLGNGTGGLSGPPLHPIALRAVYECAQALPGFPLVGVGGVSRPSHAVAFFLAGASAVELGAAHLADPAAGVKLVRSLRRWCRRHKVCTTAELVGTAHF